MCSLRLLTLRRFDVVVALTSPPLISFLASLFVSIKGGRFCFWVMDLNPDEAIAAGWLRADSFTSRFLQRMLIFSLKRADRTIVLDRFMRDRVLRKGADANRVSIVAPWSHDDAVSYSVEGRHAFRAAYGLAEKFVVMYSGNHSPCHPLDTFLNAALALSPKQEFAFCFVGGGSEQHKVRKFVHRNGLKNVMALPYQPLKDLSASLSAADLHVVVMGENFTGIVHPCKIYNILNIGVPTLYIGPAESHISDLAPAIGPDHLFVARTGDSPGVVQQIVRAAAAEGKPAKRSISEALDFSKHTLLPQLVSLLELNECDQLSIHDAVPQTSFKPQ